MFLLFIPSSFPCVKFFLFFLHFSVFLLFVCLSYFPLFVLPELLLLFSFFLSLTPFCLPFSLRSSLETLAVFGKVVHKLHKIRKLLYFE